MNIRTLLIIGLGILLFSGCRSNLNPLPQRTYNFSIITQNSKVQFIFKDKMNYESLKSITLPSWEGCEGQFRRGAFTSCTEQRIEHYINETFEIPQIALDSVIEGKIGYQFVLNEDGLISNGEITKNPGGGLAEELERRLLAMPLMEPAHINTADQVATEISLEVFCDIVLR